MFDGGDTFTYAEGDIPVLSQPDRVEVVVPHYWVQERLPIGTIDHETRTITSPYRSVFALRDDAAKTFATYWLDNLVEALGERPGKWYLDTTGEICGLDGPHVLYVPLPGEVADSLEARLPVIDAFVAIEGEAGAVVREVRFENVRFEYAEFVTPPAAVPPLGCVRSRCCRCVSTAPRCRQQVRRRRRSGCAACAPVYSWAVGSSKVGGYGIELGEGTRGTLISGCRMADLGAGGARAGGAAEAASPGFVDHNEISDNEFIGGGRSYPGCVAILLQHVAHNVLAHNEVGDFFYSAISVGWVWDYHPSASVSNLIEGNHLHHLGQCELNDMGGIYLLGIAPGTVVRGNHIHDVACRNYGGWASTWTRRPRTWSSRQHRPRHLEPLLPPALRPREHRARQPVRVRR